MKFLDHTTTHHRR